MKKTFAETNWREAGLLVGLLVVLFFLWQTPVVYPLKILVVFFHELSHAMAAWLTGGHVQSIGLSRLEGGVCVTLGGSRFIVTSAGYLGSMLWGALILMLSTRTRLDKAVTVALSLILLFVAALFVRPFLSFGFLFGVLMGIALLAAGWYLPEHVNDFILRVIGMTSCVYAVLDIKSDIVDRPMASSDANALAELTGVPTILWGLLWMALALGVAGALLFVTSRKSKL